MNDKKQKRRDYNKKNNIILVGITGCGKTTLGRLLANCFGYGFLDIDFWIEEKTGKSTEKIFLEHGEQAFRQLETQALSDMSAINSHVIAAGSGIVELEQNWHQIKKLGTVVWIDAPLNVVARRLINSPAELIKRPLFKDFSKLQTNGILSEADKKSCYDKVLAQLEQMMKRRRNKYEEADYSFGYGVCTVENAALNLKNLLLQPQQDASFSSPAVTKHASS